MLWSAETFVDFEHSLNTSIKELRGVLCDTPSERRYIETLPRLGYRMIAPVEVGGPLPVKQAIAQPKTEVAENLQGEITLPDRPQGIWAVRRWPVLAGISVVLMVAASVYCRGSRIRVSQRRTDARLMVAVLPFENLTGDVGQDYFSDGLTEEMIAQLGRLDPQRLGVIARTSVRSRWTRSAVSKTYCAVSDWHNSGSVFLLPSSHVPRIAISDRLAEFCQPICPSYSALFVVG